MSLWYRARVKVKDPGASTDVDQGLVDGRPDDGERPAGRAVTSTTTVDRQRRGRAHIDVDTDRLAQPQGGGQRWTGQPPPSPVSFHRSTVCT